MIQAKPLSADLNRAILALSPVHNVRDNAPSTFADVMLRHSIDPRRLVVWSGGSDATFIYADPAAAELQCQQLLTLSPNCPASWPAIIRAEVNGQAEYLADHGAFPLDQIAFMRQYLKAQGLTI